MAGLLAGTRVLDLTNVLAGPFCGYQLALLGADVIKAEMPGTGDLARQLGADPELMPRHGRILSGAECGKTLHHHQSQIAKGQRCFSRLVETADVVVENFRPGVMDRLGLGYDALKEVNPD